MNVSRSLTEISTSFSGANILIYHLLLKQDGQFLVWLDDYIFDSEDTCYNYIYDADMPKYPEKSLTIYMPYEKVQIRDMVSVYRKMHPDIYIKIECDESSGEIDF